MAEHSQSIGIPPESPISSLYQGWFLDYASYVILERAVPHILDGLKPVQRRILHSLREMEDGRYNKVANVVGNTMKYHPHGDASIKDALVQLGQKDLLIDTQGNWGNPVTGDEAAAPRYIEARLSKLALDVAFNPKTTQWQASYDGRNKEPVALPMKFPLLLAQGVEGIAVGLACKILPHNFNELLDAAVAVLRGKNPKLLPDFPTGGIADFSDYRQGKRGGKVIVRAKIEPRGKQLLAITEIPFGTTSKALIDSILAANTKEKIKIRKVEDNTAQNVEILLHLPQGADPQKTIGALYVFTACEVTHAPNACVIQDGKPRFLDTLELLRASVAQTQSLLRKELEIRQEELEAQWHAVSLETLFITHKLYSRIENANNEDDAVAQIQQALVPYRPTVRRDITREDIVRLIELRFRRLARYDTKRAEEELKRIEAEMAKVHQHLQHLTEYTIGFFQELKRKYGQGRERKTRIETFASIAAAQVAVANEKLYADRVGGFVGYGLKDAELIGPCSTLDEVVVIFKDGKMRVSLVSEKTFVGKDILFVGILKKGDRDTTYNMVYANGDKGWTYVKRFQIGGITRDKVYDLTQGLPGSKVLYLTVAPSSTCDTIQAILEPGQGARKMEVDFDFASLAIKGRQAQGNILTRYRVRRVKKTGVSEKQPVGVEAT